MKEYKSLVRDFLSEYSAKLRMHRCMTQEAMAEGLRITCRAYGELERGKYCYSAVALLFLLRMLEESERNDFLRVPVAGVQL